MISKLDEQFGRDAVNRIEDALIPGLVGAKALLESFYYAFNQRDMEVFAGLWAKQELIQLNNPLGGIMRGYDSIAALYQKIFTGSARVWVEFTDIVTFESQRMVVFAGRETGAFSIDGQRLDLQIRTSRVIQWFGNQEGWRQVHHHGSIDDPGLLNEYQHAVQGK
ncbi:MAG: nuclear transport factor 2 family protein [Candidatus Thiodiazotropha sp. (ex. Lucinisca nassula)]|nr:nuclear transport factor 2 family protein [Candidatus Thiodiazotropha sp. (ex. Lucinisca nassula)]MBW9271620.1 nuclear transport factor 2 family protein [Candidatus Thiodiazotropha sp. (ex. Lucinisca nassula)]MCG7867662.1 nuclear transport factor 2 family protein [Candidatus Thiodiazotropha taylori]